MTETTTNTPPRSSAGADPEILPPADEAASPSSGKPDRVTAVSNLALGSLLLALDALDGWVDRNVPTQEQALDQRAKGQGSPQDVLLPQSEWEATYGRPEIDRTRLAVMGIAASANTRAVRATRLALQAGGLAVEAARWPLDHIFLFRPLRYGIDRVAEARDQQIDRWVEAGRELDTGSRAVAEVSLVRAAEDTVEIVTVEPHVQALVQEIVAAQGVGMTAEIIKEVREHAVSSDLGVDRAWATLRRRPKPEIALPDFAVAIRDKKPDLKEMAGRPYLGGAYAGIASRVLAFSIDVFALIIALIIGWVFVKATISMFNLDRLLQSLLGINGFGTLRIVAWGMMGHPDRLRLLDLRLDLHRRNARQDRHGAARGGAWRLAPGLLAFPATGDRLLHLRVHPRPGLLLGDREQAAPQLGRQTGRLVGRLCLARPPR